MILKKFILSLLIISLCTGCGTLDPYSRSVLATESGAAIGGTFGAALGDHLGGYNGSFWGSMIGSVAGAAVGAAAASSINKQEQEYAWVERYPAPELVIKDILLTDNNGNQCIDAGEACQITFVIVNQGDANARDVEVVLRTKGTAKKIRLSPPVEIGTISPDEEINYTVQARASLQLKTGEAKFEVYLKERGEEATIKETFAICTQGR